ncbi:GntR family transcriptional regulator [Dongia soli]|uniref:GntR family transcriptional regulator n=1 Tax=Dongia soli TaxID=600628 RepID=A0ABU5E612_9PROT|nr:GntR family transcriptional regulator [Dongia soli]MDY0881479.1 GntR family transcriptional regulator [Dongia soli]
MSGRSEQIAATICEAILGHRLKPGAKLGERDLADIFQVSRIVIRQALIRLAEDGLVTVERNRGAFVAKPSLAEAIEVFETLTMVEQGVIAQLGNRPRMSLLTELRANIERQKAALGQGNEQLAGEFGLEFHDLLVSLTRNRVLIELHAQLKRRARLLESLYRCDFDHCQLCDEHEHLVALFDRRQWAKAQQLLDDHYRLVARGYRIEDDVVAPQPLHLAFNQPVPEKPADLSARGKKAAIAARYRPNGKSSHRIKGEA